MENPKSPKQGRSKKYTKTSSNGTKTRREKDRWPALNPSLNLKIRKELIADVDYLDKLSDEEKDWLNAFNEEWINASFKHPLQPLHNTPELKSDCYRRNNARNRCQYSMALAGYNLDSINKYENRLKDTSVDEEVDKLIDKVDSKKKS